MKEQIKTSIIDTLSYFDVFNYPLTLNQIVFFLHFNRANKELVKECLSEIPIIENKHGYYFFSGKQDCAVKRKIHKNENVKKLKIAKRYTFFISRIPGVKLIALTGSLAMDSATGDDDIDLFIITRRNTLWVVRPIVNLFAKVIGKRRKYKDKRTDGKLCLNMFVDEKKLEFDDKNLYTAHEIAQLKVLYAQDNIYKNIKKENTWIKEFMPNATVRYKSKNKLGKARELALFEKILRCLNFSFYFMQYVYMSSKMTNEKVSLRKAFFHPNDNSKFVLDEYKKRRRKYFDLNAKHDNHDKYINSKDYNKRVKLYN